MHVFSLKASLQIALDGGQLQQNQQELMTSSSTMDGNQSSVPDVNVMKTSKDTQVSHNRDYSIPGHTMSAANRSQKKVNVHCKIIFCDLIFYLPGHSVALNVFLTLTLTLDKCQN